MTKAKRPRPYSFDYQAQGTPKRYLLSGIPPTLWRKFQARAKREHVAMRQVILTAVEAWTNRPEAAED
jgi:hypothetical protein